MKYFFSLLIVAMLSVVYVAQAQSPDEKTPLEVLMEQLQAEGNTAESLLSVPAHLIMLDGAPVWVFEYEDAETAQADADLIAADASLIAEMELVWEATPHFFLAESLLVLYVGDDAEVIATLKTLLGDEIAVGGSTPAGSITDYDSLVASLEARGAEVEYKEEIFQDFLSVDGKVITVNGIDVQVFEYADAVEAQAEAAQIPPDGSSFATIMVTWIDDPHFYQQGSLIVLYVGSDQATLDLLESVLGTQFAGR